MAGSGPGPLPAIATFRASSSASRSFTHSISRGGPEGATAGTNSSGVVTMPAGRPSWVSPSCRSTSRKPRPASNDLPTNAWKSDRNASSRPSWSLAASRSGSVCIRARFLGQQACELARVDDRVVPVAVVHQDMHLLGLAGELPEPRDPLGQLVLGIEVGEPGGGSVVFAFPLLDVAAVEPVVGQVGCGRSGHRGHARAESLGHVDGRIRDAMLGEEAQGALGVAVVHPGGVAELHGDPVIGQALDRFEDVGAAVIPGQKPLWK